MNPPRIQLMQLGKTYGKARIIDDLSLNVEPGEFLALLGPSGSGKSTLLNIVAGLEQQTDGKVLFDELDVSHLRPGSRKAAMVFQTSALYPTMSVRQNIGFSLQAAGMPRKLVSSKVVEVARLLRIEDLLDRKPAQLAGGQLQRVAIGRALARDHRIFLLDEPLSHLDAKLRADLCNELKRLHRQFNRTTLYVTHDQIKAMTLAARVAVLHDGKIQQCDRPEVIYARPSNMFVAGFVGSPAMSFVRGTLVAVNGFLGVASTPDTMLPLPNLAPMISSRSAGEPVVVGIRPEHVRIVPSGTPASTSGRVKRFETTGPDIYLTIAVADTDIVARLAPGRCVPASGPVTVRICGERVSLFHQTSGLRLN